MCLEELSYKDSDQVLCCHECAVGVCGDCTVKQVVANSGVLVCCQCRHSIGTRMPAYQVAKIADRMRFGMACGLC